jgi:hypothetical protein
MNVNNLTKNVVGDMGTKIRFYFYFYLLFILIIAWRRSQVLVELRFSVEPTGTLFWRPLEVVLFRRARNIFSQFFRQFRILNRNLSDSLKNLPTLFKKWFVYFHQNKS